MSVKRLKIPQPTTSEFYKEAFHDILDTVFTIEMQADINLSEIRSILRKHLPEKLLDSVTVDDRTFQSSIRRLSTLVFTLRSIRAMGLGAYEKEIMAAEIARLWHSEPSKK